MLFSSFFLQKNIDRIHALNKLKVLCVYGTELTLEIAMIDTLVHLVSPVFFLFVF